MEKYYKTLLFALPEIVYQVDKKGKFIYLNDSIRQLGYAPDDLLGKHFTEIIAHEDHASVDRDLFLSGKDASVPILPSPFFFNERRTGNRITRNLKVKLLCGKLNECGENHYIDGEVFATGLYETPAQGNKFIGTIGVIRELTGDVEHEKTLMRIERFYRLLIDNSLDVITIAAHDGMVLFMSQSIERCLGHAPIYYIGENVNEFVHPEDLSVIKLAFSENYSTFDPALRIEYRCLHADTTWRYFETSFVRIMDDEKSHIICYVMHSMDITRRRNAEKALANRERVYRDLLRTSPDAIALFDSDGDIIMANDKAAEITGMPRVELIGMNYLSLIIYKNRGEAFKIKKIIDTEGIIRDFQFELIHISGAEVPIEISISAIRNDSGNPEGYITIFRDITLRKKAEAERLLLLARLEEDRNALRVRNDAIEKDLIMARKILMGLMPSTCFNPHVAFYFKPMDIIGGDFYDFIQFENSEKIGIFICDVAGHGLPSAFITSMIKSTIDQAADSHDNPALLLSLLNNMLIPVSGGRFVTALYCIYDGADRILTFARAGHNKPYRISEDSAALMESEKKCIPLGILYNDMLNDIGKEYVNVTVSLKPGEKILFYTDGLTESRKIKVSASGYGELNEEQDDNDFESSGLIEVMKENISMKPLHFIENIVKQLTEYRGHDSFEDDVCLICLDIV